MRMLIVSALCLVAVLIGACELPTACAENWPAWRGPSGDSICREANLPLQWSEGAANVRKTALPEWGTSTPAVWENSIFLTSETDGKLLLLSIDRNSAKTIWQREVGAGTANRKPPNGENRAAKFHDMHNMASPSPVTDGERVIVHFGNGDLASFAFDGRQEWKRNLADDFGSYTIWWGHANSPVLYENLVISICMQDSMAGVWDKLSPSYLVAHDKQTGAPVWERKRMTEADAEQCDAYTTPIVYERDGHHEMLVMGGTQLDAYNPSTGDQIWSLGGLIGGRTITGPTVAHGLAYATVGMRGPLHAVRLGSNGALKADDVVAWKEDHNTPDTCCPVVAGDLLFFIADNGVASCFGAKDGAFKWRKRLRGENYKASPVLADGQIYFLSREGICTVIKAGDKFEQLAENRLDDDFVASPAISNGQIFLRGHKSLYIISR